MTFKMYVDEAGLPYSEYGVYKGVDIGRQRSILAVAECELWCWNEYCLGEDRVLLSYDWSRWPKNRDANPGNRDHAAQVMLNCARWLIDRIRHEDRCSVWEYS
jgi:hypothetical protein